MNNSTHNQEHLQDQQSSQSFQQKIQLFNSQKAQKQLQGVDEQGKENKNKQQFKDFKDFKSIQDQKQKPKILEKQIIEQRQEQQKIISELERKAQEEFGKLEVCFVVDITKSMDVYKQQTSNCIFGSVEEIRSKTGRQASFAIVAYQDIAEFQQLGHKYQQHDFTADSQKIVDYLQELRCDGGDDLCEDIKGGLKQMVTNLKWRAKFKIAVLICDAPCHGMKYHDHRIGDDYPDDDIEEAIDLMIQQDIMLIGVQFVNHTSIMIQEFHNIYKRKGKQQLFKSFDLQKVRSEDIWKHLTRLIKDSSVTRTGANNNSTKTNDKYEDGAIQTLFKIKNSRQFDQNTVIDQQFQVNRVELRAESFETNLKSIRNLKSKDFDIISEGNQIFVRQRESYDKTKLVYLMKKKDDTQQHFYILKQVSTDWIEECRSHLICKILMVKFMRELREKQKKFHKDIPQIYYSDLLLLQQSDDQFFIAERFQEGEYTKYNNNWGFILGENTIMNQIAQAFTYYTYYISGCQYMICDIQGIGNQFTSSAICTKTKNDFFDKTDVGEDGQLMYIGSFQNKKQLAREILAIIDIKI